MSLNEYSWSQHNLTNTEYAGKYVTHDSINKENIVRQLESNENDFELGKHTIEYNGRKMDVRLNLNTDWASFMYDKTFEDQLGHKEFNEVITYFLTPDHWKSSSPLHPE